MSTLNEQVCKAYLGCGSIRKVAKQFGLSRFAVDRIVTGRGDKTCETANPSFVTGTVAPVTTSPIIPVTGNYRRQYEAEKELRTSIQASFEEYKANHAIISVLETQFTEPSIIEPTTAKHESESLAAMFYADWHAYEQVRKQEVNGLNEYNPIICRDSIETATKAFVKLTNERRTLTTINVAMVNFLGDLMSGHLWPDQIEGNAGSPLEEALFVTDLIISSLDYILKHGEFTTVYVNTVDGNHSRITGKEKRKSNRAKHSLEWLIFKYVERYYEHLGETRLVFNVSESIHSYIDLAFGMDKRHPNGLTWRLTHGDEGIRYKGGVGGIAVPANRQIKIWNEARHADMTAFGHLHTSEYLKRYLAVGSTLGMSPNGLNHEFEPPQQAMLTVEKTKGITAYYPIFVR
jgi:hypothetical protein